MSASVRSGSALPRPAAEPARPLGRIWALGFCSASDWVDSSTGSCSIRSCNGTTCSAVQIATPPRRLLGSRRDTLWDGLFHVATWVAVVAGVWLLWRRTGDWSWARSGGELVGWMLVGWGLFNLIEGLVNHHLIGVHHVRESGSQTAWDLAFLAFGALLVSGGWLLSRTERRGPSRF